MAALMLADIINGADVGMDDLAGIPHIRIKIA